MIALWKKAALVATVLLVAPAGSFAADLTGSLAQMVSRWETGDPNLSLLLKLHLTSRGGDPVVVVRVADGVDASHVLSELSAAGFRLTSTSRVDARFVEGYLPIRLQRHVIDDRRRRATMAILTQLPWPRM